MLTIEFPAEDQGERMPSLNHSYICVQILRQLFQNDTIQPLIELTLNVGNGLTPDICVYSREEIRPNFLRDITRFHEMPILAIEVLSASQNIQDILEKASNLVEAGVKSVWTVEPYGQTIFVTSKNGEQLHHNRAIESEGIQVDFTQVFKIDD